jgi:hypothetical protein
MTKFHGAALALLVLCPGLGLAQVPAQSTDQLKLVVSEGQKITITDRAGRETSGRLVKLAEDTVSLQVQDEIKSWELAEIQRIQKREADPLGNGILIGALVGAGVTGATVGYWCAQEECAPEAWISVALWGAVGGGIGALIDAAHAKNRTVYEAPSRRTSISVVPVVTPDAKALAVRMTF